MKTIILIISTCGLNLFLSCCSTLFPDEKLSMQRTDYRGNELKTGGYYFREDKTSSRVVIYFLYNNGVLLYGGTPIISEIEKREQEFTNGEWEHSRKNDKAAWGIFRIDGKKIIIQGWGDSGGGGMPVVTKYGDIVNDSTFVLTKSIVYDKESFMNEVYHFKQFSPKPDSTNVYIK
jgi:hypothetical protein